MTEYYNSRRIRTNAYFIIENKCSGLLSHVEFPLTSKGNWLKGDTHLQESQRYHFIGSSWKAAKEYSPVLL